MLLGEKLKRSQKFKIQNKSQKQCESFVLTNAALDKESETAQLYLIKQKTTKVMILDFNRINGKTFAQLNITVPLKDQNGCYLISEQGDIHICGHFIEAPKSQIQLNKNSDKNGNYLKARFTKRDTIQADKDESIDKKSSIKPTQKLPQNNQKIIKQEKVEEAPIRRSSRVRTPSSSVTSNTDNIKSLIPNNILKKDQKEIKKSQKSKQQEEIKEDDKSKNKSKDRNSLKSLLENLDDDQEDSDQDFDQKNNSDIQSDEQFSQKEGSDDQSQSESDDDEQNDQQSKQDQINKAKKANINQKDQTQKVEKIQRNANLQIVQQISKQQTPSNNENSLYGIQQSRLQQLSVLMKLPTKKPSFV